MKHRLLIANCIGFAALFCVARACSAQSAPDRAGEIRALVPTGYIVRGGAPAKPAQRNDSVFWQDTVRTEPVGRVRIGLLDGSILNVGPQSSLLVAKHDPDAQQTQLELNYGRVRATVVRIAQPHGNFQVRTPVAVAGVVGTRFDILTSFDWTVVLCLSGLVRARNADEHIPGEVILHEGEFTRIVRGMPPTPPAPASIDQLREGEEATAIPPGPMGWTRAEISWPPAGCGDEFTLRVRAWAKAAQGSPDAETPVDPDLINGKLVLGKTILPVEGGRLLLTVLAGSNIPEGRFAPEGNQDLVATKIWPPMKTVEGNGWRAPRAVFAGSAFYVLGPMNSASRPEFLLAGQSAELLWVGTCGAGFLAPAGSGASHEVALSLAGKPVARGEVSLVQVSYHQPTPPTVLKGQESRFEIELHGLRDLGRFSQGRPMLVTTVTNHTPAVIGNLQSQTPGAQVSGDTITFRVGSENIDPSGTVRLQVSGHGRRAGGFQFSVENKLDEALDLPSAPLTPVPPGT